MNKNDMETSEALCLPEPETEEVRMLRDFLSPKRWQFIVREALGKERICRAVKMEHEQCGKSLRKCLKQVSAEVPWSRFSHWQRNCRNRLGPEWERLVDRRLPPNPKAVASEIRAAAIALRQVDTGVSCETARMYLKRQFQAKGDLGDSTLRRIWSEAGLTRPEDAGDESRFEEVRKFNGGGGFALIGAAALETGITDKLARAAQEVGRANASAQKEFIQPCKFDGRDDNGRFTAEYNHFTRIGVESGTADSRWESDTSKRGHCDLNKLPVLGMRPETLAQHLLVMGMVPLITERRGFDGLDGYNGRWLELLGAPAYLPPTMDKTLSQLALLNVGDAIWSEHGQFWVAKAREWSEGEVFWRQFVIYVDTTTEPYWTQKFALSGKVSRLGRVMPCLSRVALMGGPGVPLMIRTCAGTISLKKTLLEVIESADATIGHGELQRLTVVDAEGASVKMLAALKAMPDRDFITVLKGQGAKGISLEWPKPWEPYREHDLIRSGTVTLHGEGAPEGGLKLYGVEMKREGSRHPHPTMFLTSARPKNLAPAEVADTYLSRWPNQEQFFRVSRNGGGFEHSHGYGGEYVTNVAIETALEKSVRQIARAEKCVAEKKVQLMDAKTLLNCAQTPSQIKATEEAVKRAEQECADFKNQLSKAHEKYQELSTMPREIYERDTTRENIVTALQSMAILLIEFVLREYFGNVKMQLRTFIEHIISAPTTVRTSHRRILYQIESNSRNHERTELLRKACQEATRRKLRRDGKLLVFEVVDPPPDYAPLSELLAKLF